MLTKKYFEQCEQGALDVLKYDPNNLVALYILLLLSCEARVLKNTGKNILIESVSHAEDYAIRIKSVSEYLGYISWSEIYLSLDKKEEAEEVLVDLCDTYPRFPHAFLKLWDLRFREGRYMD
jgi:hypothetical protein